MPVLNFGSLNIDLVYRVERIVRPGETLASEGFGIFAGGKGANQSVALARAGAEVHHAGRVGEDGRWLLDTLAAAGVHTGPTQVAAPPERTGHAVIQVDRAGQNAIVIHAGANRAIPRGHMDATLRAMPPGATLLLQDEINDVPYLIEAGRALGLRVCLNPAPFSDAIRGYPLHLLDSLVVNEVEAAGLVGGGEADDMVRRLAQRLPGTHAVVTLGERGVVYLGPAAPADRGPLRVPAYRVRAVDTTAAGDTFIGYFLAERERGRAVADALRTACAAAALCVTRHGAADSIPARAEVEAFLATAP